MGWLKKVLTHPAFWAVVGVVGGIVAQNQFDLWGRVMPTTTASK